MPLLEKKDYRIFTSREGDWDVAAYMQGEAVGILYQGHSRSQTFRAILEDLLGGQVLAKEVDMGGGGDWSPNCRTGGKNAVLERGRNAEGSHHVVSEQDSWNRSDRRGVHPERISVQEFVAGFDLEFTFENLCRLPGPATEQMLHYAYCRKSDGIYVLRGDNARFLNHSTDPNLGLGPNKEENVALQDIRKWGRVDRQLLRL